MRNVFVACARLAGGLALVVVGLGCGDSPIAPTLRPAPGGPLPLEVSSVSPRVGPAGVATPIRITGTGFETGATLTLDDVATPATFVDSRTLTAQAPPRAVGDVDVVVSNPGGATSRLERGFTYILTLTGLTLTGNSVMNVIGETRQLTATAGYSDGTSSDVTSESAWATSAPETVAVSPDGLLTAKAIGRSSVSVKYPASTPPASSRFSFTEAIVTPVGTFTVSGRVREPGGTGGDHGTGGIAGAVVRQVESGQSILTDEFGLYTLVALTHARLAFSKTDFEPVEIEATPDGVDDVPMQRVIRIDAGSAPQTLTLAPNDMAYQITSDTRCEPCKMIRITSGQDTARVRLTWNSATLDLHVWVNGQMFPGARAVRVVEADVAVVGGETLVYVGVTSGPRSFIGHQLFTVSVTSGG